MRATPSATFYRADGTSGSWNYERSGVNSTQSMSIQNAGANGVHCRMAAIGAAWVASVMYGHFTADAEL